MLRAAGAAGTAWLAGPACRTVPTPPPPVVGPPRSLVLVRFGGGVRRQDVFGDESTCIAPFLRALAKKGAYVPGLWNDHLTRHDCATAYLLTGRYGSRLQSNEAGAENLAELRRTPLLPESFRAALDLPAYRALAAGTPASFVGDGALSFGDDASHPSLSGDPSLPGAAHVHLANDRMLQVATDVLGLRPASSEVQRQFFKDATDAVLAAHPLPHAELTEPFRDALVDRLAANRPFVSVAEADEWLMRLVTHTMRRTRPRLVTVGLSTPDLAHRGAWSVYEDAVRRNDLLLERLIEFTSHDPYYRERTDFLIATDCGRGGSSATFAEHDDPFANPDHRRVFLVGFGPSFRSGAVIQGRREQVDVAATAARVLGYELDGVDGRTIEEMLA